MKARNGFVSNSSSTSFLVAFKDSASGTNKKQFDFIAKYLIPDFHNNNGSRPDLRKFNTTVAEHRIELLKEIKVLERDWHSIDNKQKTLTKFIKFPRVKDAVELCLSIVSGDESTRHERRKESRKLEEWELNQESEVDCKIRHLEEKKKKAKHEQEIIQTQLDKLNDLSESTQIVGWTESNNGGLLQDLVTEMEKEGMLIILEKFTS